MISNKELGSEILIRNIGGAKISNLARNRLRQTFKLKTTSHHLLNLMQAKNNVIVCPILSHIERDTSGPTILGDLSIINNDEK